MNSYPSATKELIPLTVYRNGTATSSYTVCVLPERTAPADGSAWATPTTLDGQTGVLIDHLTSGVYKIWARATSNPEVPVIYLGTIVVE